MECTISKHAISTITKVSADLNKKRKQKSKKP